MSPHERRLRLKTQRRRPMTYEVFTRSVHMPSYDGLLWSFRCTCGFTFEPHYFHTMREWRRHHAAAHRREGQKVAL